VWPNLSLHITSFRLRAWYANTIERRNYPKPDRICDLDQLAEGAAEGEGLGLPLGLPLALPPGAALELGDGALAAG